MLKNRKEKEIKKEKFVLEIDEIVKKKYLNLLGFAARSGKISYGEEDILNGIEKGKIALTLIAKDQYVDTKNMKMAEAGFKTKDKAGKAKADLTKLKKALLEELKD